MALGDPEKRINLNSLTNWCVTESDFPYIIAADLHLGPVSLFARISKIIVKMRISNLTHKKVTKLTKKYKQKIQTKPFRLKNFTLHYITKLTRIFLALQNCTSV